MSPRDGTVTSTNPSWNTECTSNTSYYIRSSDKSIKLSLFVRVLSVGQGKLEINSSKELWISSCEILFAKRLS